VRDPEGNFRIVPSVETRPVRKRACGETSLLCETGRNTLKWLFFRATDFSHRTLAHGRSGAESGTSVYKYDPNTWGPREVDLTVAPVGGWQNPTVTGAT
jgi:hypothetical protein